MSHCSYRFGKAPLVDHRESTDAFLGHASRRDKHRLESSSRFGGGAHDFFDPNLRGIAFRSEQSGARRAAGRNLDSELGPTRAFKIAATIYGLLMHLP